RHTHHCLPQHLRSNPPVWPSQRAAVGERTLSPASRARQFRDTEGGGNHTWFIHACPCPPPVGPVPSSVTSRHRDATRRTSRSVGEPRRDTVPRRRLPGGAVARRTPVRPVSPGRPPSPERSERGPHHRRPWGHTQ